jgi:predicted glycogen debranching enzyme
MRREWLLTNGIGGFAMGTASGINTRRYHGLLVAATKPPTERTLLLAAIDATAQVQGNPVGLSANQYPGAIYPDGYHYLRGFSVSAETATWTYRAADVAVTRRVTIHRGVNACTISYTNEGRSKTALTLRPLVCCRSYHGDSHVTGDYPSELNFLAESTQLDHAGTSLLLLHGGAERTPVQGWYYRFEHVREFERGLEGKEDLYCPCELDYELKPGERITLVASAQGAQAPATEDEKIAKVFNVGPLLKDAAEKFLVSTKERDTIIAGYPWFTDWGRDTMISLPGICLQTGRVSMARKILTDYSTQMNQGLIPNRFVEDGETPQYNTVDATLWFANAIYKTLQTEWDEPFARTMLVALRDVFHWHVKGTHFNIKVDPADGLLSQGEEGVQLTWMDAKVGDWVVTPRRGKAVEINGLWINALRVMEWVANKLGEPSKKYSDAAKKAEAAFDDRFWMEDRGFYADTVDPLDVSLRPNQVIALAVPFGAAKEDHARRALEVVGRELLSPVGLRTLGPSEHGYQGRYDGALPQLDAAYHQGTAWPWLLGQYVTAYVRVTGDRQEAKKILRGAREMIAEYGMGGLAEVYDGDPPQRPNGCPWQAWSVGEFLRAWVEDAEGK